MLKIISVLLYFTTFYGIKYIALRDKELGLTKECFPKWKEILYSILFIANIFIIPNNIGLIIMGLGCGYLTISAIIDQYSKLVYIVPGLLILFVTMICESIQYQQIHIYTVVIFALLQLFSSMKLFGYGDAQMGMIPGIIFYLSFQSNIMRALIFECIVLLVAEILFYINATIKKNMNGPFKLKESAPFGPAILYATFACITIINIMTYIGYEFSL